MDVEGSVGRLRYLKSFCIATVLLRIVVNGMSSNEHCLYLRMCQIEPSDVIQNDGPGKSAERSILIGVQSRPPTALNDLPRPKAGS